MSTIINVDKISKGNKLQISFTNDFIIEGDYSLVNNNITVNFVGDITFTDKLYVLRGTIDTEVVMSCSLCLADTIVKINVDIHEFFTNSLVDDLEADETDFFKFCGCDLDVSPAIITNILLNIPMKLYCNENCKGLCPICGANLNETSCCCQSPIDPRLESLSSFFDNKEEV